MGGGTGLVDYKDDLGQTSISIPCEYDYVDIVSVHPMAELIMSTPYLVQSLNLPNKKP